MASSVALKPPGQNVVTRAFEHAMRSLLLVLSHRRFLGRLATRLPFTRPMVARFVAGETVEAALPAIRRLNDAGFRSTVDILGESVMDEEAARAAASAYVDALRLLADNGIDLNMSLKLSQMGLGLGPQVARQNAGRVLAAAAELGAFVRIDMEDHTTTDATLEVWRALRPMMAGDGDVGVVLQSALRRTEADAEALIAEGARIRLCKGAYKEPASVAYADKAEVDAAYLRITERLLTDGRYPAIATHDDRMVEHAIAYARAHDIGPERFEFQMLYGIRRDLQERLVADGWTVRIYVPSGREWYPYFMRRLAERPANVAFLLKSVLRERRHP
ncbi:MAG TPA: proline dehydrogenase family protein [Candidatus Limnocylindrales bacterium]|nr:proline dehydrogenase family protein [Candidatus Limnocylindrales bacterium]